MAWGKSKSDSEGSSSEKAAPVAGEQDTPVPDRSESDSVLVALIAQTEQLNERLTKLEDRFDASMSPREGEETDLRDLRVNSARLAAELERVSEELQSDIDSVAPSAEPLESAAQPAPIDLTDPIADSDPTLRLPGAHGKSGWLPAED